MSVHVRIKQKSWFRKKLNMEEVIKITNLSYGVCDENYRLIRNEVAKHILIYDEGSLARGIDCSLDGTDILLVLSLPTTKEEIRCFYDVIEKLCQELKTKEFIREEEVVCLKDKEKFIQYDEDGSVCGLEDLQEKICNNQYDHFEIFGVYHPISIGECEIKEIGNHLDSFANFLNRLQSQDVYYATPRIYRVLEQLVGIYAIGAEIPSVVPTKPYIVLNQIQGIEEWYVMLREGKVIKYEDFISHVCREEYYDFNHVVVTLSDEKIDELVKQYGVEI